jgi:hypothetical protein
MDGPISFSLIVIDLDQSRAGAATSQGRATGAPRMRGTIVMPPLDCPYLIGHAHAGMVHAPF